jgi:ATP-dependent exoDNAse (exonuclease V) alpha subunit
MTEATNRPASTIHRPFYREQEFDTDVIVVDEFSMVDVEVCNMLISMIENPNAKIIFVGDDAQLTSVGAGNVFFDIIHSGVVPITMLSKPFRYDSNGGVFVATNVRQGKNFFDDHMVKHIGDKYVVCDNYEFIERETDQIFDEIMSIYQRLLNKRIKPKDILCLSPFNVGDIGTYAINNHIQNIVNPPKPNQPVLTRTIGRTNIYFRTGDKVINKRNDYKVLPLESYQMIEESGGLLSADDVPHTTIFNGQIGYIRDLNERYCTIQFGEELVVFDKN